jgi:protein TonB
MLFSLIALAVSFGAHAADTLAVIDSKVPCEPPAYPRASLVNEEKGVVTLAMQVGPDGVVADSKVEKSSGFKNLDKAALKALSACKFKPGTKDGKAELSWTKVEYNWKLD